MAVYRKNNRAYSLGQPTSEISAAPIVAKRVPTTRDVAEIGTLWIYQNDAGTDDVFVLSSVVANESAWASIGSGNGVFDSLTVADSITMNSGTCTIISDDDAVKSIYLHADAGTTETIEIHSEQGTSVDSIALLSTLGGISITSGISDINAVVISASGATGGMLLAAGSNGVAVETDDGLFRVRTGTGAISLGTDAFAKTITIGNATGATAVDILAGTGNVSVNSDLEFGTAAKGIVFQAGPKIVSGAGSPDTVVTAPKGSLFLRTDGDGVANRAYINIDGVTSWAALTTAA